MEIFMTVTQNIFLEITQWQHFENWLTFDWVITKWSYGCFVWITV